ncbi:MAG: hypothetical protein N3A58_03185 [Spirochaetes bacterium]|nr:hypothetical protein [Spirochaetota bacterium]
MYGQENNNNLDTKFNELKKSVENQQNDQNINLEPTRLPILRTILILIVLIIIFFISQYFIKRKNINLTINNQISEIIYKEPLTNKSFFGIIKIFDKYFAAIIDESIKIIYEITNQEEIDTAILLKSKNTNPNKSFFELIKNIATGSNNQNFDGLKKIKEKLNSIKWRKNE